MPEHRQLKRKGQRREEPSASVQDRLARILRGEEGSLTPSGRLVAAYLRDHLALVPFETGASIADRIGVSQMTVIRFIRSLGYRSLRELKGDLRAASNEEESAFDDALERFRVRHGGFGELRESLDLELRAVIKAYELTTTARWEAVVERLAHQSYIYVTGFQASKGVALDFAGRLKYARPGVRYAEGATGVYSEVLEADPRTSCLVLIDTAAYARKGVRLARRARDLGLPLVIVTDRFSRWAYEFTELVLQGHTHVNTFWDSTASLSVILNLLINAVAVRLGHRAEERFERMRELGRYFEEFEPLRQADGGSARGRSRRR